MICVIVDFGNFRATVNDWVSTEIDRFKTIHVHQLLVQLVNLIVWGDDNSKIRQLFYSAQVTELVVRNVDCLKHGQLSNVYWQLRHAKIGQV